jgi:hypothetical protein
LMLPPLDELLDDVDDAEFVGETLAAVVAVAVGGGIVAGISTVCALLAANVSLITLDDVGICRHVCGIFEA